MSGTARELPDRLHFLRLPQFHFGFLSIANVAHRAQVENPLIRSALEGMPRQRKRRAGDGELHCKRCFIDSPAGNFSRLSDRTQYKLSLQELDCSIFELTVAK